MARVDGSPLVVLGLVLLVPFLNRYIGLVSSFSFNPAPAFKFRLQHLLLGPSPSASEWLLLSLLMTFTAYHTYSISPLSENQLAARDLFRHARLPISCASTQLRSRVAAMTLGELGLQNFQVTNERSVGGSQAADLSDSAAAVGGDALERLMRRLGSMAGRQSYLLLGPRPLLDCHYCNHVADLRLYALPPILLRYALEMLFIGIFTTSSGILNAIDNAFGGFQTGRGVSASPQQEAGGSASRPRLQATIWRAPLVTFVIVMAAFEVTVVFDWWGWSGDARSAWNHWHHNLYLARHILSVALLWLPYLYPTPIRRPLDTPPPTLRIAASLRNASEAISKTNLSVSLLDSSQMISKRDGEVRRAMAHCWGTSLETEAFGRSDTHTPDDSPKTSQRHGLTSSENDDQELLAAVTQRGLLRPQEARVKTRHLVQSRLDSAATQKGVTQSQQRGP